MQTNAPAGSEFVDQFNRAVAFGQISSGDVSSNDPRIANIRSNSINTQNTSASSMGVGLGGSINLSGFIDPEPYPDPTNAGSINLSGGIDGNGGSIITSSGGGSINTYEGYIQLGKSGARTTIVSSASGFDRTVTLPNNTGTVALVSDVQRAGTNNIAANVTALASSSLSGSNNTAVGTNALNANQAGASNSAFGARALQLNQSGNNNCAFGEESLRQATGGQNCAFGVNTLRGATTASDSTGFGHGALISANAASNVALGRSAGEVVTTGANNTLLGAYADVDTGARAGCVVLGRSAKSPAVNGSLAIGGTGGSAMGNLVATSGGTSAGQDLVIYLNGTRYLIALKT